VNNSNNKQQMLIIGITGTLGAGKGTIVDFLVQSKGLVHFSVRGFISEEIVRQGLPVNRDSMVKVANELRALHSPSYIVDQLYGRALLNGKDCVIESIRTPGEIDSLRIKGNFVLFAVDAAPKSRYNRIVVRNSETDSVSYQTFTDNEQREMNSDDPNKQNLRKCIEMADYVFENNKSINELQAQIETVINHLLEAGK
jgi:dephospho-CoA kinase